MRNEVEWVPWYRRRNYKGDLSEQEKRILDSFRTQQKHPSTRYQDLAEEVQSYIIRIDFDLYEARKDILLERSGFMGAFVAFLIISYFQEMLWSPVLLYIFAPIAIVFFIDGLRKRRQLDADFFPKGEGVLSSTDEGIRTEWELDYIVRQRRTNKENPESKT